ncbi:MAG: DUF1905 domain-containing protein [Candidatus Dormibacteraeota bacterium]|nr:DUF1905 domain-containing protein [Candidatus Dormibacteraeota bacterium]MBO0744476.1 DUF1905 domain-containing protein [Candidatus Dormibacteraeota bacterium]
MAQTFTGILEQARQGGALVALPPEVVEALGGTRVRVSGTFAGIEFASSTMPTGGGGACVGIHKATRERAGIHFGDQVEIVLERDDRERAVEIPPALQRALDANPEAREAFARLAPTHRREYARWVAEAKREETVQRRVETTLERILDAGERS